MGGEQVCQQISECRSIEWRFRMPGPTYGEQLRHLVDQYRSTGSQWPAATRDIAAWAIDQGLWQPYPETIVRQCAEHLSRAMREDYITDPQGRNVRAKHAARIVQDDGTQLVLWEDIRAANPQHMEIAFQQRRQQIVGDCRQLKTDVDSYNENANSGRPIQMVFDFTQDLAELEMIESILV